MAKIHSHSVIPVLRGDLFQLVAIVVRGIIYEHTTRADFSFNFVDHCS